MTPEPTTLAELVTFAYREPALIDFDLSVPAGRIVLLIGLNGAGKSTALRLLAGELAPAAGRVRILGDDPARARTRRHLFLLREEAAPPVHLTAAETVRLHLDLYGRPGSRRALVKAALARTGLLEVASRRSRTFSKGMRRRLELACLLAVDPEVWLLDEPQSGLDPRGLRLLRELCLEARGRGRTLIIASHALSDIPALADEVVVLSQGRTSFRGSKEALLETVGAEAWVVRDAPADFAPALRSLAAQQGAAVEGPGIPPALLEDLLFQAERPSS